MSTPISAASYDTLDTGTLHVNPDTLYTAGLQLQATRDRLLVASRVFSGQVVGLTSELIPAEIPELHAAWLRAEGVARYPDRGLESQLDWIAGGLEEIMAALLDAIREYSAVDVAAAGHLSTTELR